MADLMTALRNADAAGDTEAAQRIAAMIKAQQQQQPAAEEPGLMDQLGHQLGRTARIGIEGAGNLAGMVSDPFGQFLPGYQKTGELASHLADNLGLPKPQGGIEEGVDAAGKALVGTGLTMGAGAGAGATQLLETPLLHGLSSVLGAGASDAVRQSGGGEGAQIAAAVGAGMLPGGAAGVPNAVKSVIRGGDPSKVAEALRAFEVAGTTPSVGQASGNRVMQAMESMMAKTPGSAGVMSRAGEGQAQGLGQSLTRIADDLAPKSSPTIAGRAIEKGITGEGGFVDQFKAKASELYDKLDQYMPGDTPVPIRATQSFLAKATTPTKGAEATSALLANPKLGAIGQALGQDLAAAQNGALPYEAVKALRSRVGDMIADSGLTSDVPRAQLKQLYGALSQDIRNQAATNPQAYAAANRAENYYRAGMDRLDKVESVVQKNGGPEKIFQAAMSGTKEGATTLRAVMQSLGNDEAKVVTSSVVRRLGRANPSAQNDVGDAFSTETFLTNWNSMSPEAKAVLFNRMGPDFRQNMDQIAKVASNLRQGSQVFRNPSGTGQALAQGATVGGAVISALLGSPATAASIGAGVGAANLGAKVLTSPAVVKWLAQNSNTPLHALPGQIGALSTLGQNDEGAQQLADYLQQ